MLTYSIYTIASLVLLYFSLVTSKLKYASPVWNNIMTTDANKPECIEQKFVSLCFSHFFPPTPYNYAAHFSF